MTRYLVVLFAIAAIGVAAPAYAHHSFAATYLEDQSVTIEGELVQFLFRSPHSYVHVVVKEKDGTQVRYAVEWAAPGRNAEDHRVRMVTLRRPKDGFTWGQRAGEVVD